MSDTIKAIRHKESIERNIALILKFLVVDQDAMADHIYFMVDDIKHSLSVMVELVDTPKI